MTERSGTLSLSKSKTRWWVLADEQLLAYKDQQPKDSLIRELAPPEEIINLEDATSVGRIVPFFSHNVRKT